MPVTHPAQKIMPLVSGCVLIVCISGCITIAPPSPSLSWKSLTKPKVQQASYEEKTVDAPADPKNPARLKVAYGRLMEETGQIVEARKSYQEALQLQPREVDALLGLARLDVTAGHLDQAELNFKKAIKTAPNSSQAHYDLGQFYASQSRWEEASKMLTKAMLAEPDNTQFRYALAVTLAHTGKVDAALPHFIRTVGDAEAHYNVGLILQSDGHLDDAERHFAMAVTKKPELMAAQNWLAHLRQQRQDVIAREDGENSPPQPSQVVPAGHNHSSDANEADAVHSAIVAPVPHTALLPDDSSVGSLPSDTKRSPYSLFR